MVKGVNKTVIEVNNTGSKVFEKIVFYVNPGCGNLSAKSLKKAMQSFTFQFDERNNRAYKSLRQRMLLRRRMFICGVGLTVAAIITAALIIFL